MNEQDQSTPLNTKPGEEGGTASSLPRTIISLLFFAVLYYWLFKSWQVVIALVVVLLIHESGHFIAMKMFGYKSVNMTFVPFVGAYVSGEATSLSNRNKLIVLLAGPVPGIIIGSILYFIHGLYPYPVLLSFAFIFLLQNTFNLLPVFPLDGGQFFQALFFNGGKKIQLVFLYLSLAAIGWCFYQWDYYWPVLIMALLIIVKINKLHFLQRVHKKLDAAGVDYACTFDDLTDEEYWQIRNVLIEENKMLARRFTVNEYAENEHELIPFVETVLVPAYEDTLDFSQKLIFLFIWALAFALPVLLWFWHTGTI
jgi:stage IV sporulation protein FB